MTTRSAGHLSLPSLEADGAAAGFALDQRPVGAIEQELQPFFLERLAQHLGRRLRRAGVHEPTCTTVTSMPAASSGRWRFQAEQAAADDDRVLQVFAASIISSVSLMSR